MAMAPKPPTLAVGDKLPDVMLATLDGASVTLASAAAKKPVVIEFWATWCPLCRALEPQMAAAKEKYGDRVTFIGIAMPQSETPDQVKTFITDKKMKGTFLYDTKGDAYKALASTHTSYLVVADANGTVVYTGVGGEQSVEDAIAKLKLPSSGAMMKAEPMAMQRAPR